MSKTIDRFTGDLFLVELPEDLKRCLQSRLSKTKSASTLEDMIVQVLSKHFARELAERKQDRVRRDRAPLDSYLPRDVDPFEPVKLKGAKLPLDFHEISQRSTRGGIPKILKS
ncbi:hypothetical protein [Pseudobacteriovorax antillogorgiicola]|uniref:Uncharacterized protein n=1 Tax=Pseudobacteriovorax antillogorgiicola TaxID=1513793 RepID=A0A1Y6CKI4_9BACT|nr:hypothetical protein [Pseudobacteriovorax antillogorgiicola]TCS46406.1 hypothetical protein EDD56_12470 [Pseudobacteriovorax antillogorgiicola]SMF68849.1 hypothetical protein SAMN06296036_12470 [Pseudobacteriovorax antillogorgiicola]